MKLGRKTWTALVVIAALSGCAWTGAARVETSQELDRLVAAGPSIKAIEGQPPSGKQTAPETVELYYYLFKPFGKPDAVIDWQYHYVIAPASRPVYPVRPFAKITVFRRDRHDAAALQQIREAAAQAGADAVIDLVRIPQTGPMAGYSAQMLGYSYAGTAVVRKAP